MTVPDRLDRVMQYAEARAVYLRLRDRVVGVLMESGDQPPEMTADRILQVILDDLLGQP